MKPHQDAWIKFGAALVVLFFLVLDYNYYSRLWAARQARLAAQAAQELPRRQVRAQIEDIRLHAAELPPCPLVYPLLDSQGRTTPLGSYLSCLAMEEACALSQPVLRLPDAGKIFQDFNLFTTDSLPRPAYKTELPLRFEAGDFAEGTLLPSRNGARVHLRFWGTRPEKTYDHTFSQGELHTAPHWIVICLRDYAGFPPAAPSAGEIPPAFTDDADLNRAAGLESIFRSGGALLVSHWEKILAKSPDNPGLVRRWAEILDAREGKAHPEPEEALLSKYPASSALRNGVIREAMAGGKYDEALDLIWDGLKRDDDDSSLYEWAAQCLESKDEWPEAVELLKNRTQRYPQNAKAWMDLAGALRGEAERLRGSKTAFAAGDPDGNVFKAKIAEGLKAAQQATWVAPQDCRAWVALLGYGTDASLDKADMDDYFAKAVQLDPYEYPAYEEYLNYLKPENPGGDDQGFAFIQKYEGRFPALFSQTAGGLLQAPGPGAALDAPDRRKQLMKRVQDFPAWNELELCYQAQLQRRPADMDAWREYLFWAGLAGTTDRVFHFAQILAEPNPELKALPPYLVLIARDEGQNNGAPSQIGEACQTLLGWDDNNWRVWNLYAQYAVANHLPKEAKKALIAIGDHRDDEVWTPDDFEKTRAGLGLEPIPLRGAAPVPAASPAKPVPSPVPAAPPQKSKHSKKHFKGVRKTPKGHAAGTGVK